MFNLTLNKTSISNIPTESLTAGNTYEFKLSTTEDDLIMRVVTDTWHCDYTQENGIYKVKIPLDCTKIGIGFWNSDKCTSVHYIPVVPSILSGFTEPMPMDDYLCKKYISSVSKIVTDDELNDTSNNAISNRAVTEKIIGLENIVRNLKNYVEKLTYPVKVHEMKGLFVTMFEYNGRGSIYYKDEDYSCVIEVYEGGKILSSAPLPTGYLTVGTWKNEGKNYIVVKSESLIGYTITPIGCDFKNCEKLIIKDGVTAHVQS